MLKFKNLLTKINDFTTKNTISYLFMIIIFMFCNIISFTNMSNLKESLNNIKNINNKLEKNIHNLESKVVVNEQVGIININDIACLQISRDLSFCAVTDNLYVEKSIFDLDGNSTIDIYCQPLYQKNYQGQGKFNISDRELKFDILSLISRIKDVYDIYKKPTMKEFNNTKVVFTIKNYEIGTYENNILKLKGE